MLVKTVIVQHINPNDCWNLVLSQAFDKDYDIVRYEYRDQKSKDGAMSNVKIQSILLEKGYKLDLYNGKVSLGTLLEHSNRSEMIIGTLLTNEKSEIVAHLSYFKDGVYYTTPGTDNLENSVVEVYYKEK